MKVLGQSFRASGVVLGVEKKSRNPPFQLLSIARCNVVEAMLEQLMLDVCWQTGPLREHSRTEALQDAEILLGQWSLQGAGAASAPPSASHLFSAAAWKLLNSRT